jgi:cytochrome c
VSKERTVWIGFAIAGMIAMGASLALARVHPFGDAGLFAAKDAEAPIMNDAQAPWKVRAILEKKCADCHSTQTHAPIYGRFAPVSWLMERDIIHGRQAMDLSFWDRYSADQKQSLAAKIAHETKAHDMPLPQYRMIHWNAGVTDAEIRTLASWAHVSSGAALEMHLFGAGDPARGKELFEKRCTGCHALAQNHQGPGLQGVYGRTSGSVANYAYSAALKKAQIVWDEMSLEQWLTDPDAFLPGNNMDFLVPRPQERQDIISYLRQTSGK